MYGAVSGAVDFLTARAADSALAVPHFRLCLVLVLHYTLEVCALVCSWLRQRDGTVFRSHGGSLDWSAPMLPPRGSLQAQG